MAAKRSRTAANLIDQVGEGLARLLQQQTDALTSDDTPLSEEADKAVIAGAIAMAWTAIDSATDAKVRERSMKITT